MLELYGHPFSSYCQKALIALYENDTPFEFRKLGHENDAVDRQFRALWPLQRMPILVDAGRTVVEASIIIEHLHLYHPGPVRLMPDDPKAALDVRVMDRSFDNYIATPQQRIVLNALREPASRDPHGDNQARELLETAYHWLDTRMAGRQWAAGDSFSLADCAAAPFLFYADWTHAVAPSFANVWSYRQRLLARPSVVHAVDEARPYRPLFPLGAPDRD